MEKENLIDQHGKKKVLELENVGIIDYFAEFSSSRNI
jgi:hypothetical protein